MSETKKGWTPGPWRWEINLASKRIVLSGGNPKYDLYVLDFVRWGMGGAAPRLLDHEKSVGGLMLMERAEAFAVPVPGREHHERWFRTIDHPDAHLISAAPDLYEALERYLRTTDASAEVEEQARAALAKARGKAPAP